MSETSKREVAPLMVMVDNDLCLPLSSFESAQWSESTLQLKVKFNGWTWEMDLNSEKLSEEYVEAVGLMLHEYAQGASDQPLLQINERTVSERVGMLRVEKMLDEKLARSKQAWKTGNTLEEYLEKNTDYFEQLVQEKKKRMEEQQQQQMSGVRRKIGLG